MIFQWNHCADEVDLYMKKKYLLVWLMSLRFIFPVLYSAKCVRTFHKTGFPSMNAKPNNYVQGYES